ncbi:hypothetical protein [Treponema sp.]|uniref:hypothetical protein n=1 Tax=Treponema sp. TaxID=166 RepID=UPI003F11A60A
MKKIILCLFFAAIIPLAVFSEELTFSKMGFTIVNDDDEETEYDSFSGLLFDILFSTNFNAYYNKYPWYNGELYIKYEDDSPEKENKQGKKKSKPGRSWRMEAETGGFCFPARKIIGSETRIEGIIFHVLGPVIEYQHMLKANNDKSMGNLKIGGQCFLFQSNALSMSVIFQWNKIYNIEPVYKKAYGPSVGMTLRSYMIPKCVFEWRASLALISDDRIISESHLELGYMIKGPLEIYGAWKRQENEVLNFTSDAFAIGAKFHF